MSPYFREIERVYWKRKPVYTDLEFRSIDELVGSGEVSQIATIPSDAVVKVNPPCTDPTVKLRYEKLSSDSLPECGLFIRNGQGIISKRGIVGLDSRTCIDGLMAEAVSLCSYSDQIYSDFANAKQSESVLFSLENFHSTNNYYHWMVQSLPKLHLLKLSGMMSKGGSLCISGSPSEFIKGSLQLLGNSHFELIASSTASIVANPIFSSIPSGNGHISKWCIDFLNELVPETASNGLPERIYVSRGEVHRRRLHNEADLIGRLIQQGFHVVTPGQMSIVEQAQLFRNAKEIVGVHGAALTNLVFAKSGTKVVEIMPRNYTHWYFQSIAARTGCEHHAVVGSEKSLRRTRRVGVAAADIVVAPELVLNCL